MERMHVSLGRWTGLLGRMHIISGLGFFLLAVGVAVATLTFGYAELDVKPTHPPLIRVGDLEPAMILWTTGALMLFAFILLYSGIWFSRASNAFFEIGSKKSIEQLSLDADTTLALLEFQDQASIRHFGYGIFALKRVLIIEVFFFLLLIVLSLYLRSRFL